MIRRPTARERGAKIRVAPPSTGARTFGPGYRLKHDVPTTRSLVKNFTAGLQQECDPIFICEISFNRERDFTRLGWLTARDPRCRRRPQPGAAPPRRPAPRALCAPRPSPAMAP